MSYRAPLLSFPAASVVAAITYSKMTAASSDAVMVICGSVGSRSILTWDRIAASFANAAARLMTFRPSLVSARASNKNVMTAIGVLGFRGNSGIRAGIMLPHGCASDGVVLLTHNHTPVPPFGNSKTIFLPPSYIQGKCSDNTIHTLSTEHRLLAGIMADPVTIAAPCCGEDD